MNIPSILFFFIVMWGLGHAIMRLVKPPQNPFEREFIRLGLGLGVFSVLSILLNLFHIPLHWSIFLILSLISPFTLILALFKKQLNVPKFNITKENIFFVIVILIVLIHLFIFLTGAFSYSYLEDGDPWDHARSIRYISSQKTAFEPSTSGDIFKFMDPYPPIFDILMAVLYQITNDMIWTLKFFNALLISLSLIYFFIFCKKLSNDPTKSLLATIVLFLIPSYMSHFIWALTISMVLFFPCIYSLESIKDDPKWKYIAAVMIGALLISQPSMAVVLSLMLFLYWFIKSLTFKTFNKYIIVAGLLGILIASLWWGVVYVRWGSPLKNEWGGVYSPNDLQNQKRLSQFAPGFRVIGTADRVYTFSDFFFVNFPNMINNPIGLGPVIFLLLILSLIYIFINIKSLFKQENEWKILCLVWLIFTFLGIQGARLPVQFIAFRFWMLFAIPLSFLVGGVLTEMIGTKTITRSVLLILVLVGIVMTSGIIKYKINSSIWPPGYMANPDELNAYTTFNENTSKHERILSACPLSTYKLAAYNKDECMWCPTDISFRGNLINTTPEEISKLMKSERYKYLLFDVSCLQTYPSVVLQDKAQQLFNSSMFILSKNFNGIILLELK